MQRYTVTATTAHTTITEQYSNLGSAMLAAYWYGWDRSYTVADSLGRVVARSYGTANPTNEERGYIRAAHHAYYWERRQVPPHKLAGRKSHSRTRTPQEDTREEPG